MINRDVMKRIYRRVSILLYNIYKKEDVSIVIGIKNISDVERMINCFKSIRGQNYDQGLITIMLVDYDSAPALIPQYKEICKRYNVDYIRVEHKPIWSRAHALNIGVKRARTKYILCADIDIIFEKNYIGEAVKELRRNPFQVIVSAALDLPDIQIGGKNYDELKALTAPRYNSKYANGIILALAYFYHKLRGYDEAYRIWGVEDDDLIKRFELFEVLPRPINERASYLHQYHPKFRNLMRFCGLGFHEYLMENRLHFKNNNSIRRNKHGWGDIEQPMARMDLRRLLQKYSGKDVYLLLTGGNKGDGLIYISGITLLKKYGVNFIEIRYPEQASGKTLLVLGSGGFSASYHRMPERIDYYMDKFKEIIILPSSFDARCDVVKRFIENLPKKVTVFCREGYSYKGVLDHIPYKKNVFLDHDLAMSFDYAKWKKPGKGRLNSFRLDGERFRGRIIPKDNYDVSLNKKGEWEVSLEQRWGELLEDISGYKEVHTDRTHVAIAAAMLGKETYVYSNNYHKVKGVYEHSLAGLANAKWMGSGIFLKKEVGRLV